MSNTLSDNLGNLEHYMKLFPKDVYIEVDVRCTINDDVPADFASVARVTASSYETFEKVISADGGMVTKKITLHIRQ